jgi:hypothetical protein
MPLTIGNKINLQELERQAALGHGNQYLHQSGTGLALSAPVRSRKTFSSFPMARAPNTPMAYDKSRPW